MYGTIAVLNDRPDSVTQCLLVDPPPSFFSNASQFKILSRLEFIAELISLLGPSSTLAASLQTRTNSLSKLRDITLLDRVPLLRGNGEEYSFESNRIGGHNSWFNGKTVVLHESVGGQVNIVRPDMMFFIGIQEELVAYATQQDFDKIVNYGFKSGSRRETLECVVPNGRFRSAFSPHLNIENGNLRMVGSYVHFQVPALLHFTQSGLVFGTAEVPKAWRK